MNQRRLGQQGIAVSAMGLGCMAMSGTYGAADDGESIATIHAALDAGINLLNTADFYGMGHNELLIGQALRGRKRQQTLLAVKFGSLRAPGGAFIGFDGRPAAVKNFLCYSLRRLGTDYVDFYIPSRVDRQVPIEDTVGAIAEMIQEGKVRHLGLSECAAETVRRAHRVHPVSLLEIEYSLFTRDIEAAHLPVLRELGVAVLAYGALSRGLLGNQIQDPARLDAGDIRRNMPRFAQANLATNRRLVQALEDFARRKACTVSQLCFAWLLAQGADIIPLIGTKRRTYLQENLGAEDVVLSPEDLRKLAELVPPAAVAGTRYPEPGMATLNG